MSVEEVLNDSVQNRMRQKNYINTNEVVMKSGDLYFARNVLTNDRRLLENVLVEQNMQDQSISENTNRQILKG